MHGDIGEITRLNYNEVKTSLKSLNFLAPEKLPLDRISKRSGLLKNLQAFLEEPKLIKTWFSTRKNSHCTLGLKLAEISAFLDEKMLEKDSWGSEMAFFIELEGKKEGIIVQKYLFSWN